MPSSASTHLDCPYGINRLSITHGNPTMSAVLVVSVGATGFGVPTPSEMTMFRGKTGVRAIVTATGVAASIPADYRNYPSGSEFRAVPSSGKYQRTPRPNKIVSSAADWSRKSSPSFLPYSPCRRSCRHFSLPSAGSSRERLASWAAASPSSTSCLGRTSLSTLYAGAIGTVVVAILPVMWTTPVVLVRWILVQQGFGPTGLELVTGHVWRRIPVGATLSASTR